MMSSPTLGDVTGTGTGSPRGTGTGADVKSGIVISCDKASLGIWRQLKGKVKSLGDEVVKWLQLQDTLYDSIKCLYSDINRGEVAWDLVLSEIR